MKSLVFPAPPPSYGRDGSGLADGSRLVVDEEFCFVVAGDEESPELVLWIHGNGSDCGYESPLLVSMSLQPPFPFVVGIEWPGYGPLANKSPSVDGCDAAAAEAFARWGGRKRVVMVGRSLGSGSATRIARRLGEKLAGLVLWSPITNVSKVAAQFVGNFVSFFVPKHWDVLDDISYVTCPLLVIGGTDDTLTPQSMVESVFAKAVSPQKRLYLVPGATHNEGWDFDGDLWPQICQDMYGEGELNLDQLAMEATKEVEEQQQDVVVPTPIDAQVVIVGAGPVGLFLAASLCFLGLDPAQIVMMEKHSSYQRQHVLRLEPSSLDGAPTKLRELIAPLVGVTKTALLEKTLLDVVTDFGVSIYRPCFVRDQLPLCRVLVGADGSKSFVRDELLGGVKYREALQYVLDVRLEIRSASCPKKLSLPQQMLAMSKHVVEESVSQKKTDQGTFPCTLRVLIDKQEHEAMRHAGSSLRSPLQLESLPSSVSSSIYRWLEYRQSCFAQESYVNVRCSSLELAIYHARRVGARRLDNSTVFCCGDAAFGVPFFRALNNGLLSATQLAKCIMADLRQNNNNNNNVVSPDVDIQITKSSEISSRGFFGTIAQSFAASTGVSRNLAHVSSRQMSNMAQDALFTDTEADDPVLRYTKFMSRLIEREFCVAKAKRDGLTIVRLASTKK